MRPFLNSHVDRYVMRYVDHADPLTKFIVESQTTFDIDVQYIRCMVRPLNIWSHYVDISSLKEEGKMHVKQVGGFNYEIFLNLDSVIYKALACVITSTDELNMITDFMEIMFKTYHQQKMESFDDQFI